MVGLVYIVQYGIDNFDLDYSVFMCHRLIIFRGFLNVKLDGVKFYVIFFLVFYMCYLACQKDIEESCFGLMCALLQLLNFVSHAYFPSPGGMRNPHSHLLKTLPNGALPLNLFVSKIL